MTLFYSSGLHGRQTHFEIKVFLNSSSKPDKKPSKWRSYDSYAKYRICSWSYYKRWIFWIPRKNDITDDVISAAIYPHSYKYLPENCGQSELDFYPKSTYTREKCLQAEFARNLISGNHFSPSRLGTNERAGSDSWFFEWVGTGDWFSSNSASENVHIKARISIK